MRRHGLTDSGNSNKLARNFEFGRPERIDCHGLSIHVKILLIKILRFLYNENPFRRFNDIYE